MGRMSGRDSSSTLNFSTLFSVGNDEQGLMLMDLLLGLALALLIIGILHQVAGLVFRGYLHSSNRAELNYSSQVALDCIQQDIRTARDFQVSPDGKYLTITGASGANVYIYVNNGNLYRTDVSTVPVAENFSEVNFVKSGSTLQGKLKLHHQESEYEVDFFCFSRSLKAQE